MRTFIWLHISCIIWSCIMLNLWLTTCTVPSCDQGPSLNDFFRNVNWKEYELLTDLSSYM